MRLARSDDHNVRLIGVQALAEHHGWHGKYLIVFIQNFTAGVVNIYTVYTKYYSRHDKYLILFIQNITAGMVNI